MTSDSSLQQAESLALEQTLRQAIAHQQAGRVADAERLYRAILQAQPGHAVANYNLGVLAVRDGRPVAGLPYFKAALEASPGLARFWLSYMEALIMTGQTDAARLVLDQGRQQGLSGEAVEALAVKLKASSISKPASQEINTLMTLFKEGRYTEVTTLAQGMTVCFPLYEFGWKALGAALVKMGRCEDALKPLHKAAELSPNDAEVHNNLGGVLQELGRFGEAEASFRRSLQIDPGFAQAHNNLGISLLSSGKYDEGWPEYEYRREGSSRKPLLSATSLPQWTGQTPQIGDGILIIGEQGMGDQLQFSRYLPLLADRFSGRVSIIVGHPLRTLFRRSFPEVEILDAIPDNQDTWQWQCPIMSLALAFKTTINTIPGNIPYLIADPQKVRKFEELLGEKTKPRVGLVWAGGTRLDQPETWGVNARRNIKLSLFSRLKDINVEFYSLQKGQPAESELAELKSSSWDGPNILDFTSQLSDFSDTAAFVENLDLVISVDTSTVHLAAALGKPVWILNRFDTCWRWMVDRKDSPWYPTVTLFRQPGIGDWQSVISEVANRLAQYG